MTIGIGLLCQCTYLMRDRTIDPLGDPILGVPGADVDLRKRSGGNDLQRYTLRCKEPYFYLWRQRSSS